ncbi:hypothetical protein [Halarsenatibacter silvermanii]|uniref:Uncharacterized protein n=1 Tax=Halarsenatibacter silvermanii TaxID=321763 RepID=A0A1G9RA78_9FIRM|nr:hypothetical protein [Halarsenatibacter silvermanii]SDM20134.1 hypothetical protein SAMN04488692_12115 [Halarsenatibacter silvermanii]
MERFKHIINLINNNQKDNKNDNNTDISNEEKQEFWGQYKKENKNYLLKNNDSFDFVGFWTHEIYSSNDLKNLFKALEEFDENKIYDFREKSIADTVKSKIYSPNIFTKNIGIITSKHSYNSQLINIDPPSEFEYIRVKLYHQLDSLTFLSFLFVLRKNKMKFLDDILKQDIKSLYENHSFEKFNPPSIIKKKQIEKEKDLLYKTATDWIKEKAPGICSKQNLHHPVCDLILRNQSNPIKNEPKYMKTLGLNEKFNSWNFENTTGLYLTHPYQKYEDDKRRKLILAGNKEKIIDSNNKLLHDIGGDMTSYKIPLFIDDKVSRILIPWVFFYISEVFLKYLYKTRDELTQVSFSEFQEDYSKIKNLENEFSWIESIVPHFINDIQKSKSFINYLKQNFKFKPLLLHRQKKDFFSYIQSLLNQNLEFMSKEYENISARYYSNINLFSALSNKELSDDNLFIQKIVLVITALMLVINIIMLALNFD